MGERKGIASGQVIRPHVCISPATAVRAALIRWGLPVTESPDFRKESYIAPSQSALASQLITISGREQKAFSHPRLYGFEFSVEDAKAASKAVFMADESVFLIDHLREDHVAGNRLSRRLKSDPSFQDACRRKDREAQMESGLLALKLEKRIDVLELSEDLDYGKAEELAIRDLELALDALDGIASLMRDPEAKVSNLAREMHAILLRGEMKERSEWDLALTLIDKRRHPDRESAKSAAEVEDTTPLVPLTPFETPSAGMAEPKADAKLEAKGAAEQEVKRGAGEFPGKMRDLGEELYDDIIRGPELIVLVPKNHGADMEDAIRKAEAVNRVIASNKNMDAALVESDKWRRVQSGLSCWTGTMTAYEAPGKPFGPYVEFTDPQTHLRYIFKVPEKYVGVKNGILVAEHPDFTIDVEGKDRFVSAARVDLIERFPSETLGWYLTDPKHGIPFGDIVDKNAIGARYPWRVGKRVGLIVRDAGALNAGPRSILLNIKPSSYSFGVIVEAPLMQEAIKGDADLGKPRG